MTEERKYLALDYRSGEWRSCKLLVMHYPMATVRNVLVIFEGDLEPVIRPFRGMLRIRGEPSLPLFEWAEGRGQGEGREG